MGASKCEEDAEPESREEAGNYTDFVGRVPVHGLRG